MHPENLDDDEEGSRVYLEFLNAVVHCQGRASRYRPAVESAWAEISPDQRLMLTVRFLCVLEPILEDLDEASKG